jgi:hypothetical protein
VNGCPGSQRISTRLGALPGPPAITNKTRHCDLKYVYLRSRVDCAKLHFDLPYNRNGGVASLAFRYGVANIDDRLADWLAKFKSIDVTTVFQEWSRRDDRPWRQ